MPGTLPGTEGGTMPGTLPGTEGGTMPGTLPGTEGGTVPGTLPGTEGGTVPGTLPGTVEIFFSFLRKIIAPDSLTYKLTVMLAKILKEAKEFAHSIINDYPELSFYKDHAYKLDKILTIEDQSASVKKAASLMRNKWEVMGHSYYHAEKVAREAALIIFIENTIPEKTESLAELALLSGYLHDIERDQKNHPLKAALFFEREFNDLNKFEKTIVSYSIQNHEAFKKTETAGSREELIVSGTIYDADKFRWGPDNFLYTLWDIAEHSNISARQIIKSYNHGIEGIKKIRTTFRTQTGKKYGPEFIDTGLEIGERLYQYIKEHIS